MATKSSARLATNLVGRKVRLLTDEDARDAARRQGTLADDVISELTAARWFPAIGSIKKRVGVTVGEIVAVHLNKDGDLTYTIAFNGELVELLSDLWRLEPDATSEIFPIESEATPG